MGLSNIVKDKRIPFKNRSILLFCRYMWAFSWLSFIVTLLNVVFPSETNLYLAMLGGFIFSSYVLIYIIGTVENLRNINFDSRTKFYLCFLTILLIPLSSLLEALAVIVAVLNPIKGFEVIDKN